MGSPSSTNPPASTGTPRWIAIGAAFLIPAVVLPVVAGVVISRAGGSTRGAPVRVAYAQVQALFDRSCTSCHPSVNPSLDLLPGHSYASLINQRALEDPAYLRVVAGDPGRSFLYLKVAGFGRDGQIGGRMPFRRPPLAAADLRLLRDWIQQGAREPDGRLPPPAVGTPGSEQPLLNVPAASRPTGTGTITGRVIDERRRPIAGALVTLLLRGPSQPGGEEHYRVAATDSTGRFILAHAPAGRFELKAYAPKRIYVSRIVALRAGGTTSVMFGLPDRALGTPTISHARVRPGRGGESLSMIVHGPNLDPNYTLAANPRSGRVFELHRPGAAEGTWRRTIPAQLPGRWTFLAVDRLCSVSAFITVPAHGRSPR